METNAKHGYTTKKENFMMKEFYQKQLRLTENEFEEFWEVIKTPLPATFRINPTHLNHQEIIRKLESSLFNTEDFKLKCIP